MFYSAISSLLFYIFALAALLSAIGVVALRNPVSSALSMALCFGFTAAIFFGMGASFLGISQVIVYAGAILVLFLFIIMMLDVKDEEKTTDSTIFSCAGVVIAGVFAGVITSAALRLPGATGGACPFHALVDNLCALCVGQDCPAAVEQAQQVASYGGALPELSGAVADTSCLGSVLFSQYSITFVILSFALLAGAAGAVAIGRKLRKD